MSTQINRKVLFDENSKAIRDNVSPRLNSFGSIFFEEGWLVNKNPVALTPTASVVRRVIEVGGEWSVRQGKLARGAIGDRNPTEFDKEIISPDPGKSFILTSPRLW